MGVGRVVQCGSLNLLRQQFIRDVLLLLPWNNNSERWVILPLSVNEMNRAQKQNGTASAFAMVNVVSTEALMWGHGLSKADLFL